MKYTTETIIKIIFFCIFFTSFFYFTYKTIRDNYLIRHYGVYTIGEIKEVEGTNGGVVVYFSFIYSNDTIRTSGQYANFSNPISSHKRYYVQLLRSNLQKSRILLDNPVPDSIKDAPPYGWNKLPDE